MEAELDAKLERIGPLMWKGELGFVDSAKATMTKVIDAVQSITSGRATDQTIARRKLSCFGDPEPCKMLKVEGGRKFCGACGCGKWLLADLDGGPSPKLQNHYLNCPLRRPGFSNSGEQG